MSSVCYTGWFFIYMDKAPNPACEFKFATFIMKNRVLQEKKIGLAFIFAFICKGLIFVIINDFMV